jgi:hypothetical protein
MKIGGRTMQMVAGDTMMGSAIDVKNGEGTNWTLRQRVNEFLFAPFHPPRALLDTDRFCLV